MNWGALKTAVSAWSNRTDLAAVYPAMLGLAEQRILNGDPGSPSRPLRHPAMLATVSLTASSGAAALPADCLDVELLTVLVAGGRKALDYRPPAQIAAQGKPSGTPAFFGLRGGQIILSADWSGAVELLYYARPATPVADADENWIMRDAPGLYLYSMLAEVGLYLRDDALLASAMQLYGQAASALQTSGDQRQMGGLAALTIMAG